MAPRRLRELEVARRQVRGRYSGQRDAIVRIVSYGRVCSDLLGIGRRRRKIHKQGMIELQHVTRRIEVRDGVVAETRIEGEGFLGFFDVRVRAVSKLSASSMSM